MKAESLDDDPSNIYRELVDKYEKLMSIQRESTVRRSVALAVSGLESEMKAFLERGQRLNKHDKEESACAPDALSVTGTSSSGYSDETSTKSTQTDSAPGYFLCSIDGDEDCKLSIYDGSSLSLDSRFRNRPEYRDLFKDIFAVLKKAADRKAEGEQLPLLNDVENESEKIAVVPPVTPAAENIPDMSEMDFDSQSMISSAISEQSIAMSECITKLERKTLKKQYAAVAAAKSTQILQDGTIMLPTKREPLDYLAEGLGLKKRSRNRKNRTPDRSDSPNKSPHNSPSRSPRQHGSPRKRKDYRPFDFQAIPSPLATQQNRQSHKVTEDRHSNSVNTDKQRNVPQASGSSSASNEADSIQYRPSTLFQDFHKLKKLDMSYAEVLRKASDNNHHHIQRQQQAQQGVDPAPRHSQGHKKSHRSNNFYQQQRQRTSRH